MTADRSRLIGVALVVLSAVAWSLNGLYVRYLTTDLYTTLVGRGLAISILLAIALVVLRGRGAARLVAYNARRAAIVVVSGSLCMISFIGALFYTTVANVTVIYASLR